MECPSETYSWAALPEDRALALAHDRRPTMTSWGYASRDSHVPALDVGSVFLWFDTRSEMLAFLGTVELEGHLSDRGQVLKRSVRRLLSRVHRGRVGSDEGLRRLNDLLGSRVQFAWWGLLGDLIDGDGSWAPEIRRRFRSRTGGGHSGSPGPVAPDEVATFLEFLAEHGM